MNCKKLILATVLGFVVMFLISGLWYLIIMKGYYNEQFSEVFRQESKMIWIAIGYLVGAFLLALIYPIGYKGGAPMNEGLRFGILMGLLIALPMGLTLYGVYTIPLIPTIINIVYQVVEKGIGGLFIGLVYGKSSKSAS
jgi:hypothetical protein